MAHHGLLALRKTRQLLSVVLRAILNWKVCLVARSCPALCSPLDRSLSGFSAHGIFQARILEWGTISFSRASSQPKDQTCISCVSWIAGGFFTHWAISAEAPFWTEQSPAKSTEMGKMWHSTQGMERTHVHSVRAETAPHSPHLGCACWGIQMFSLLCTHVWVTGKQDSRLEVISFSGSVHLPTWDPGRVRFAVPAAPALRLPALVCDCLCCKRVTLKVRVTLLCGSARSHHVLSICWIEWNFVWWSQAGLSSWCPSGLRQQGSHWKALSGAFISALTTGTPGPLSWLGASQHTYLLGRMKCWLLTRELRDAGGLWMGLPAEAAVPPRVSDA